MIFSTILCRSNCNTTSVYDLRMHSTSAELQRAPLSYNNYFSTGFTFCSKVVIWSELVGFNGVNERGATVWNTAQVSMSPAAKNDHSLSSCSVAVPAKKIIQIMQVPTSGYNTACEKHLKKNEKKKKRIMLLMLPALSDN